jgi:hypothetical protein
MGVVVGRYLMHIELAWLFQQSKVMLCKRSVFGKIVRQG